MDRICVYCGSRSGRGSAYADATAAFGRELVRRDLGLVYGGGGVGLMGALAESVLDAGGTVVGVIPEALSESERPPPDLTDLRVVDSMDARKREMFRLSDGFVALPGGIGTLDELLETLTRAQLGIHDLPCGLLNVDGYYDDLLAFLDGAVDEGFLAPEHRQLLTVEEGSSELLDAIEAAGPTGGNAE
ncbi:MAG: TIGR00730 family Rossman fold protein [Haloarculaceae archaeon]